MVGMFATLFALSQEELPKPAELQPGEVLRIYERAFGRKLYESVLVLTPTKAFNKNGDIRHWMKLTPTQQAQLKTIFAIEPKNLKSKKKDKPMWPSSYDAQDIWMTYRVNHIDQLWTNRDYSFPEFDCPLTKFLNDIRTALANLPNE